MKTLHRILGLAFLLLFWFVMPFLISGCHNFPRDSYMTGVKSTINTPWGPSTIEAAIVATGTAAKNVSLPDVVPPVAAKK